MLVRVATRRGWSVEWMLDNISNAEIIELIAYEIVDRDVNEVDKFDFYFAQQAALTVASAGGKGGALKPSRYLLNSKSKGGMTLKTNEMPPDKLKNVLMTVFNCKPKKEQDNG